MNFSKNITAETLPQVVEKSFMPAFKRKWVAQGLCLTCDNRTHCVWQENRKQFCEHFE